MAGHLSTPPARPGSWRLRLVVGAIVTAIVGAAMAGWLIARTATPPSGPVILISIDSLRADRLGAYGYRAGRTPNIDALAADGVLFERAYAHVPLTLPAHLSLLSGRLPFETGVRDDEGGMVPAKLATIPTLLRKRGFKTAGIVSSGLLGHETGLAPYFHFFDDEMAARGPEPPSALHRDAAATVEVAKHWVDQQNYRFFLFLHLDEPRAPYAPLPRFATGDAYDGEVSQADAAVGNFISFLKARNLYDRAVIVLVSDHGEALGEHGEQEHGLFLYDSTLHVPLIVKMPKGDGAGRRRPDLVQQIDVMPTVLDLMGAPRPSGLRGRSLRTLLRSDDATLAAAPVYSESLFARRRFGWSELYSVTDGRYRYVRAPQPELYDLLQDRGEKENLAATDAARVARLGADLNKILAAVVAPPVAPPLGEDVRKALGLAPVLPVRETAEPGVASARTAPGPSVPAAAGPPPATPAQALADPKQHMVLMNELRSADEARAQGRLLDAIGIYRRAVEADPGMPAPWRQLGTLLLTTGQPKDALEAFARAVEIEANDVRSLTGAVSALLRLGRLEDAERIAARAVTADPVVGNELLVRVELRRKNYLAAQRAAEAAKAADAESPMPAFARGMELYQAEKYAEAAAPLDEAARLAGNRAVRPTDVLFYSGDALARVKKFSDAEARLSEELQWFPESIRAREVLASVYQETGRTAEIPAIVSGLIRALPTPEGYAAASRLLATYGDKAEAAAMRARGRQLFGESALRAAEVSARQ